MSREMRRHPLHPAVPRPEECGRVSDRTIKRKPDTAPKPANNVTRRKSYLKTK